MPLLSQCDTHWLPGTFSVADLALFQRRLTLFLYFLDFQPRIVNGSGKKVPPSEMKELFFTSRTHARLALAILNSSLFYWFFTITSDRRNLNRREIDNFPVDLDKLIESNHSDSLIKYVDELMSDLDLRSETRKMKFKHDTLKIQCIIPRKSKSILDKIDRKLGKFFDLTDEQIDYIINFDGKFRIGQSDGGDDE